MGSRQKLVGGCGRSSRQVAISGLCLSALKPPEAAATDTQSLCVQRRNHLRQNPPRFSHMEVITDPDRCSFSGRGVRAVDVGWKEIGR